MSPYIPFANDPLNISDQYGQDLIEITIKTTSPYIKGNLTLLVDKEVAAKVKELVKYAIDNKIYVSLNSSFRSTARQAQLDKNKHAITPAAKGTSRHEIGVGIDIQVYKDNSGNDKDIIKPVDMSNEKDNALVKEAKKLGFRWGGNFTNVDGVHIDAWPKDEKSKYGYSDYADAYETNQADYAEKTYEKEVFEYNGPGDNNTDKNKSIVTPVAATSPTTSNNNKTGGEKTVLKPSDKGVTDMRELIKDLIPPSGKIKVFVPPIIINSQHEPQSQPDLK